MLQIVSSRGQKEREGGTYVRLGPLHHPVMSIPHIFEGKENYCEKLLRR